MRARLIVLLITLVCWAKHHVFCAGKGRLRRYYEGIIAEKNFNAVTIYTLWLSAEDYPLLLGKFHFFCIHMYIPCTSNKNKI